MIKWLLRSRAAVAIRQRMIRGLGLLVAILLTLHALARFLTAGHRGTGEWLYLALTLVIAASVFVMLTRAGSTTRPPAQGQASRIRRPRG